MLSTATAAALAVAGFYRAAMLIGGSQPAALLLSLMLGGASVLWTYGASFYSEAWQAAAFIWAAVFLLERRVPLSALLLAVAGGTGSYGGIGSEPASGGAVAAPSRYVRTVSQSPNAVG